MELNTEALLAVQIRDNEIFELLERLAATEEMFRTPVSTIRDVVELTDATPDLIARLLGEMRGPGECEKIIGRLDEHDARLREVEQKFSKLEKQKTDAPKPMRVNRPNIVGSTVDHERIVESQIQAQAWIDSAESKRTPENKESPPQSWVENKQRIAFERASEVQKRLSDANAYFNRFWIYVAVAATVVLVVYSAVTAAVTPR